MSVQYNINTQVERRKKKKTEELHIWRPRLQLFKLTEEIDIVQHQKQSSAAAVYGNNMTSSRKGEGGGEKQFAIYCCCRVKHRQEMKDVVPEQQQRLVSVDSS